MNYENNRGDRILLHALIPENDKDPKAFAYRKWSNHHMEAHMEKVCRALSRVKLISPIAA